MYVAQSIPPQNHPNCPPYRMINHHEQPQYISQTNYAQSISGGSFQWHHDSQQHHQPSQQQQDIGQYSNQSSVPSTQSRRSSGENNSNKTPQDLDMITNLISKDNIYKDKNTEETTEDTNNPTQSTNQTNLNIFGHTMHPSSSNQTDNVIRHSSGSTNDESPICSPHPMYLHQQQQQHQQQSNFLPNMYHNHITGLLNQQFKSDSFDMSNFFGMSQINGHLPTSVPAMSLNFPHPSSMSIPNSMQMSIPASTSANNTNNTNNRNITTPGAIKTRQRSSSSDSMIKCNFCPKKFSPSEVESHRNDCRQIRGHECPQCGKRFKARGGLQQHSRIHLQEKPYGCRFCPKRFTQKSHLDQHERIHTGMKPFQCQYCGRSFRQRSQQIGHEATHPQGSQTINTSLNSSGSNSSGIFSSNTTGSESDQSCDGSPTIKDKMNSQIQAHNNAVLSMLTNQGNSNNLLNLKPEALELISGR